MSSYRRICYFTNWSQYRPGAGSFKPKDIDTSLCNHIHYAFAKIEGNSLAPTEQSDLPSNGRQGMYKEVISLKTNNPSLKVILTVGGYSVGNGPFAAVSASSRNRKDFSTQAVSYLRKYGFDGLDIDWEYPESKDNFVALAKELREAFDEEGLILTCAVAAGSEKIDAGYDVPRLARYMDYITVMTYDLHGHWDPVVGQNAPLRAASYETGYRSQLSVEWVMDYWVSKGAPKKKLNVGLATYGRGFTLANPANSQPGAASSGPSPPGRFTREDGILSYYEICEMKKSSQCYRMKDSKVPYIVNGSTWVGYDDVKSFELKLQWLRSNGFGGFAVWTIDMDDFNNISGQGKYPLLEAIN